MSTHIEWFQASECVDGLALLNASDGFSDSYGNTLDENGWALVIDNSGETMAVIEGTRIELRAFAKRLLEVAEGRTTELETRAGITAEIVYAETDEATGVVSVTCTACGAQMIDCGRGPFYDAATDDGRLHVCPVAVGR